jgi:hypothetical protein
MIHCRLAFAFAMAFLSVAGCGPEKTEPDKTDGNRHPRGWYCAGSKLADDKALGGFGPCDNLPQKCPSDLSTTKGQVSLVAYPAEIVDLRKSEAIRLLLVNRSANVLSVAACDSQLYIIQEALDATGQWKPLELFPTSYCANSFHQVFLGPDEYWRFFAPVRTGSFKTTLRFHLELGGARETGRPLYSNEYAGTIDPTAFVQAGEIRP